MSQLRILIADSDYLRRRALQDMVGAGWNPECVGSCVDAYMAFAFAIDDGRPFHLVLLDTGLRELAEHQLLRRMRAMEAGRGIAAHAAARIVMLAEHRDPRTVFAAFRDQCDAILIKPTTRQQVEAELERLHLPPPASGRHRSQPPPRIEVVTWEYHHGHGTWHDTQRHLGRRQACAAATG